MHIWAICQYYKPEPAAPSARLYGMGKHWIKAGHKVSILTGFPNHPKGEYMEGYEKPPRFKIEDHDGINVVRHRFYVTKNEGVKKKIRSHISFAWKVFKKHITASPIDKPDIIMVSSPSFVAVISAWLLSKKYGVPFIFEVRDLWPGIFKELGTIQNPKLLKFLECIELFLYRRSAAVVTVTKGFAKDIASRGIDPKKLFVITNGVSDDELEVATQPLENGQVAKLRGELQLNSMTKVLLYIGTHGTSQALGQIIDAARTMMNNSEVLFLLVGDGADKARLESLAQGMPNVQFLPSQSKERVWDYYNLAHACFIPLKDTPGFKTFIPSKMFEIMACEKPIVAMLDGEAADILKASSSALVCPPENPEVLAKELISIIENPAKAERMGQNGKKFVSQHFRHSILAKKYLILMNNLLQKPQ